MYNFFLHIIISLYYHVIMIRKDGKTWHSYIKILLIKKIVQSHELFQGKDQKTSIFDHHSVLKNQRWQGSQGIVHVVCLFVVVQYHVSFFLKKSHIYLSYLFYANNLLQMSHFWLYRIVLWNCCPALFFVFDGHSPSTMTGVKRWRILRSQRKACLLAFQRLLLFHSVHFV